MVWGIRAKIIRTVRCCAVLCCAVYHSCTQYTHTHVVKVECFFLVQPIDYFVLVLFAFVVLSVVSSVLRQEIGWEERLRNDIFCAEWDVKR